ncbi:acyl-CoA-binding protein-like [Lutzomyia longipalpis]|uniref:acyl-CoA-binding protein-like n=1 Tax=Lutzomyia longipalpis TaxID=7200 RepID=UPI002483A46B|nr:acyl-CoA-binding protein-like [Lutzomyia longipalpis]
MSLEKKFFVAADRVREFTKKMSKEDWLLIYGLYKQASEGDITRGAPSMGDYQGRAHFIAWNDLKGMDQTLAMKKYVECVEQISEKYM